MSMFFDIAHWWLIVTGLAFVGIAIIGIWDWFFWRRLPWLRWKAQQAKAEREPPGPK